eukprot:5468933-Lingulodinium_polyedra.AAC.1
MPCSTATRRRPANCARRSTTNSCFAAALPRTRGFKWGIPFAFAQAADLAGHGPQTRAAAAELR